jgi:hypothetical protein
MRIARTMIRAVLTWPVESQQGARRNALVASTTLAQEAHERREVEAFLDAHVPRLPADRLAAGAHP